LNEITDGLRGAVNAFGLIRQGVSIREPAEESALQPYTWDEEDEELMTSSMRDIEAEL